MKLITAPIRRDDSGPLVSNLHEALNHLLGKAVLGPQAESVALTDALKTDSASGLYGAATAKAVLKFQQISMGQGFTKGMVDEATATALNAKLRDLGVVFEQVEKEQAIRTGQKLGLGMSGEVVRKVQEGLTKLGEEIPEEELQNGMLGVGTREALRRFQKGERLTVSGLADTATLDALERKLAEQGGETWRVEGRLFLENGAAAAGVNLRLRQAAFGGDMKEVAACVTDKLGYYSASLSTTTPKVMLTVFAVDDSGKEQALSEPVSVRRREVMNLVLPAKLQAPLAAEFERLENAVKPHLGGRRLMDAKVTTKHDDLALLHEATGWDARVLALAAQADRLSTDSGLKSQTAYALARVGLPTDANRLALTRREDVETALKHAADNGIARLTPDEITKETKGFEDFADKRRLTLRAPGAFSTTGELLAAAGLKQPEEQRPFMRAYTTHLHTGADLWQTAKKEGVTDDQVQKLRLQGKLGYLTGNHQPVMAQLAGTAAALKADDLGALVDLDFHESHSWFKLYEKAAGGSDEAAMAKVRPPAFADGPAKEAVALACIEHARTLRAAYPTHVARRVMEKDAKHLGLKIDGQALQVHEVVKRAQALPGGFELGTKSVDAFVRKNKAVLFAGSSEKEAKALTQALRVTQRVYQISPSVESMTALLSLGFKSAQAVTQFSKDAFLGSFAHYFPSKDEAALAYDKASQVSVVAFNFFTLAQQAADTLPTVGVPGDAAQAEVEAKRGALQNLVSNCPTLESLLGEQDYAECRGCQSVLSPAAYFVDLLEYLNPDDLVWENFKARWKHTHMDAAYPHPKPFDVLMKRRPDLEHLPLTCENTETVLPYIDVVNEIMEFAVVNGVLKKEAGHDTGEATSADLIAEPQHVMPEAYEELKKARYPLNLPFDLWLEMARKFVKQHGPTLAEAMKALCATDKLYDDSAAFDRADVAMESLGLNPGEVEVLCKREILEEWWTLLGYEQEVGANDELRKTAGGVNQPNAKRLSRKLGLSYKELTALVRTEFVNPALKHVEKLHRLGLDFEKLRALGGNPLSDADATVIAARLNLGVNEVKQRVADARAAFKLADVLVLHDTDTSPSFDRTTLQCADGGVVPALALLKMMLFTRLWRKLGWSMEDMDHALCLFTSDAAKLIDTPTLGVAMRTALLHCARVGEVLAALSLDAKALPRVLCFWGVMPARGASSLYAKLFLTRRVLNDDAVFDDVAGDYLVWASRDVSAHLPALQGALGLKAEDITRLIAAAPAAMNAGKLSMESVSWFQRHAVLAKALKLDVGELLALKAISGLDPFTALLTRGAVTEAQHDIVATRTLPFIELAGELREQRVKVAELDGMLRHRFATDSKDLPKPDAALKLAHKLAAGLRQSKAEHAPPVMPDEAWMLARLRVIMPEDIATQIAAAGFGNVETMAATAENVVADGDQLPPSAFEQEASLRAGYSKVRRQQRLTWRGHLTKAKADVLKTTVLPKQAQVVLLSGLVDDLRVAQRKNFAALLRRAMDLIDASSGQKTAILQTSIAALLQDTEFANAQAMADEANELKAEFPELAATPTPVPAPEARRDWIAAWLALVLAKAKARLVSAALVDDTGADAAVAELLLPAAQALHLSGEPATCLQDVFAEAGAPVAVQGFDGFFQAPASGAFRFTVEGLASADQVTIVIDEATTAFAKLPGTPAVSTALTFTAGVFIRCQIIATTVADPASARVLIEGESFEQARIESLPLLPKVTVERIGKARWLLGKALRFVESSGTGAVMLRFALQRVADFENLSLSGLPLAQTDEASALMKMWQALARFARLPGELGTDEATVLRILDGQIADTVPMVAAVLGCDAAAILDTAGRLGLPARLAPVSLARLGRAMVVIGKLGGGVADVFKWITSAQTEMSARGLRQSVKARAGQDAWPEIAQPLFDPLRQMRRDALAGFLVHRRKLERVEQLYEEYLLDAATEPVVHTSRLAMAVGAVQLFIHRCFLNLEREVHPSTLDAELWSWMKSFALWSPGRRIFIHPENYLQPEFRDDRTHLFQELEGRLLQGNLTADLAEEAFHGYLRGLQAIAKPQLVTMHCEQHADPARNVIHVIAREPNAAPKYYYRRCSNRMWTPWEPLDVPMEGDHITCIVWRGRLHVFWLTFLPAGGQSDVAKDSNVDATAGKNSEELIQRKEKVQLNWSEYHQGKWGPRRFGQGDDATVEFDVSADFTRSRIFIHASKEPDGKGGDGPLWVSLQVSDDGVRNHGFKLISKLAPPVRDEGDAPWLNGSTFKADPSRHPTKRRAMKAMLAEFAHTDITSDKQPAKETEHIIIKTSEPFYLLTSNHPGMSTRLEDSDAVLPFFFEDTESTFFVEPSLRVKTVTEWESWGPPLMPPVVIGTIHVKPPLGPVDPGIPRPDFIPGLENAVSIGKIKPSPDWVVQNSGSIAFKDQRIGAAGILRGTSSTANIKP